MMALAPHEVATLLGRDPPARVAPGNRQEAALEEVGALHDRIRAHADTNRQIKLDSRTGQQRLETSQESEARLFQENPSLYSGFVAEKKKALGRHGVGASAATGGSY